MVISSGQATAPQPIIWPKAEVDHLSSWIDTTIPLETGWKQEANANRPVLPMVFRQKDENGAFSQPVPSSTKT